jgi:hypothetical protein
MKHHFADEERFQKTKTSDKYILGSLTSKTKRDFGSRERLREKTFEDEERIRNSLIPQQTPYF